MMFKQEQRLLAQWGICMHGGQICTHEEYAVFVGVCMRSCSQRGFLRGLHITMNDSASSCYLYFQSNRLRGDKLHALISHSTRFCITQHLFKVGHLCFEAICRTAATLLC